MMVDTVGSNFDSSWVDQQFDLWRANFPLMFDLWCASFDYSVSHYENIPFEIWESHASVSHILCLLSFSCSLKEVGKASKDVSPGPLDL